MLAMLVASCEVQYFTHFFSYEGLMEKRHQNAFQVTFFMALLEATTAFEAGKHKTT